jgi:hypothetical protein
LLARDTPLLKDPSKDDRSPVITKSAQLTEGMNPRTASRPANVSFRKANIALPSLLAITQSDAVAISQSNFPLPNHSIPFDAILANLRKICQHTNSPLYT